MVIILNGNLFLKGNALFERSIFLERNVSFGGEGTDCFPQPTSPQINVSLFP